MSKISTVASLAFFAATIAPATSAMATPAQDKQAMESFYKQRFPNVKLDDYNNGVYAIHPASREQWEEMEEFAPYELYIDEGKKVYEKPFANGKSFASCFGDDVKEIRARYPYYDEKGDTIVTLEESINKCLSDNGEKPLKYKKGKMAYVSAYIAYNGRGKKIDVKMPTNPKALAWYNRGKNFFYAKRGQLNLACADCHVYSAGKRVRSETLSPAMGHPSHFPVFRTKWSKATGDGMGTLHRRYGGCNKNIRAKPLKAQSDSYKALEYFQMVMSNGLEFNGPGARK